jgi:excisionase family DNA binding protein
MSDFLTTREMAALLRVKERKVYDLVASGGIPVRKVTGKLLFPRAEVAAWMRTGAEGDAVGAGPDERRRDLPLVFAGGHDPLLEWALRRSRSGIASFLDGALDGLDRARRGDCMAAGLHIPEDGEDWNVSAVAAAFAGAPWVLVEWVRRRRGLLLAPDLARVPASLAEARGLRFQARQPEAGSQLVLKRLLARERLTLADLHFVAGCERSETDLADALSRGRAEVGLGIEAAARLHGLRFVPLIEERFDLLVARKCWFDPPFQTFWRFCAGAEFAEKARTLGGYDLAGLGTVRFNGA